MDGTVAVLSKRGVDNYYHFMVDTLLRIGLLEDSGLSAPIDQFIVNRSLPFQRLLLEKMGLPDA